jgi:hypothetical protein
MEQDAGGRGSRCMWLPAGRYRRVGQHRSSGPAEDVPPHSGNRGLSSLSFPIPSPLLRIWESSLDIAHLSTLRKPSLPNVAPSVASEPAPARDSPLRPLITGGRLPTVIQGACLFTDDCPTPLTCRHPPPLATPILAGYVVAKAPRKSLSSTLASAAGASSLSTRTA